MTAAAVPPSRTERWLQNVMLALIATLLGWMLTTLTDLARGVADLQSRVGQVDVALSLTYRASDARRDNAAAAARIGELESRVARIEERLSGRHP